MAVIVLAAATAAFALLPRDPSTPPRVAATVPAQGARVASGETAVRVTFDQRMRHDGYSFVMLDPATFPRCASTPRQSADGRSFELHCTLLPRHAYVIGLNVGRFRNFRGANGLPAEPATLRFSTR